MLNAVKSRLSLFLRGYSSGKIAICFTALLLIFNSITFSQSNLTYGTGTVFDVGTGADVCADQFVMNGTFTLNGTICGVTIPPAPVLYNPLNNAVNQPLSLTLVWRRSQDASSYRVQLATDSLFNTLIVNDSTLTDTTKFISGLSNITNYWWRVSAKNIAGISSYSTAFKFTTIPPVPAAPVLLSPLNNATGQFLTLNLVWSKPQYYVSFRVQVSTDSLFNTLVVNDSTLTDSVRSISGLLPLTNYWWRVNAKNAAGTSSYSSVFKFRTMGTPTQVILLNPANNSTGQPVTNLLFNWRSSTDQTSAFGEANKNKNLLLTISNYWFENTTDTMTLANIIRDSTLTDTTKTLSGLSYLTNYWWRVKAKNQIGWGNFSVWFKYTTAPVPPAVLSLTVIPGGFYNASTQKLNMRDTIRVYLIDSVSCQRVDSAKEVVDSVSFSMPLNFSIANTGNYYIFVYHRNHLTIASRYRQNIIRGSTVSYNFTTDSAKAFGFNMTKVSNSPVRWGMIPGDANRDGFVDGLDQTIWIAQNGLDGYLSADFNGDSFVDGLDQTIWILFNGQSTYLPCGFDIWNPSENETKYLKELDKKIQNKIKGNN